MACNQTIIDNYTYYLNAYETASAIYNSSPTSSNLTALQSAGNQFISNANSLVSSCTGTLSSSQISTVQASITTVRQSLSQVSVLPNVENFYNNTFKSAWATATADYNNGNYSGAVSILQQLLSAVNSNQSSLGSYYSQFQSVIQQSINNMQGNSQSIGNSINTLWEQASNYYKSFPHFAMRLLAIKTAAR